MPRTIANILADYNERGQVACLGEIKPGEDVAPAQIERLAGARFPLLRRHEWRRCFDSLIECMVPVSSLPRGHPLRISCHGENFLWVLESSKRGVCKLDRCNVERVCARRRRV